MHPRLKLFLGISASLILLAVALVLFLRHLIVASFPVTKGDLPLPGLHATVDVIRDQLGVPHIRAQDEHDLMMASGYVHAQDRLWQMDILRRAGEGRLAEVLGEPALKSDMLFRTLDLRGIAGAVAVHLHPQSRALLEAYAAGVNSFIAGTGRTFPVEFDMLNYRPEPWTVEHSLLIGRLMAWDLNFAWWTDLAYGEMARKVSPEKLAEILPPDQDTVVTNTRPRPVAADLRGMRAAARSSRSLFGMGSMGAGSNAWAVASSRSLSGKPLVANDPHLPCPQPSLWYAVHYTAPGLEVAGATVPGIPLVVIGRTGGVAWGLTNAMLDDADFYEERLDSLDSSRYRFQKASRPFTVREEKIMIGQTDSLLLQCRSTLHGPVVSDLRPAGGSQTGDKPVITMRWTGGEPSDEVYGFYVMNRASCAADLEKGLRELAVPGQAAVYADTSGAIGRFVTGRVPIRSKGRPSLLFPGWTGDAEWNGFVPANEMPAVRNPASGMVIAANQKIADRGFPFYLSTLWEPPARLQRIEQLLGSADQFSREDMMAFQQDVLSPYARDLLPFLLQACDSGRGTGGEVVSALGYLHNWDFRFTQDDIASAVYHAFYVRLVRNIYEDELGKDLLSDFTYVGGIPARVTLKLLQSDSSSWFDDVRTPQRESRADVLRTSLAEALQDLQSTLGPEMKNWRWGTLHTLTFEHPFGRRKPLNRVFNLGPFPAAGGGTTIAKTEFELMNPYAVEVAASLRIVTDLGGPRECYLIITGGQSGQALHHHYDDQTSLWLNGGYHRLTMDWDDITSQQWEHLRLRP